MRVWIVVVFLCTGACSTIPVEDKLWARAVESGDEADYERYYRFVDHKEERLRIARMINNCVRNGGVWFKDYPLYTPREGECRRRSY